jgi:hypothetical protein
LMPFAKRGVNKVLGCSLFRTGEEEPMSVVSEILRRSGVKVGKVDRKISQITGRIGSFFDPYTCKVTAHIFNQKSINLIELVCEGAWGRPGEKVLSDYLKILCHNFDDLSLEDIERSIDWERSDSKGKGSHKARTQAVALIKNIEDEMR